MIEKYYLIGDFSKITGISKRMLRHYDKINLFTPAKQSEDNGYRYYAQSQMEELRKIQFLKELGFTLAKIKEIMNTSMDLVDFTELLKDKELELTNDADLIKTSLLRLKRTLYHLENQPPSTFPSVDQLLDIEGSMKMTLEKKKETFEKVDLKKLMNRDIFIERIEEVLERDQGDYYYFLTMDIDYFMHVNDIDGYEVGDAVILNVFSMIVEKMKLEMENQSDILLLARLGGDECGVFLKNADHLKLMTCVEDIFTAIRSFDFKTVGCTRQISISAGIAKGNKPVHVAELNDKSTKALIQAKRQGRDQYQVI